MFEITVRAHFDAVHAVRSCRGRAEEPHAHRWRCDIGIAAETLNDAGCVVDFADVDRELAKAAEELAARPLHQRPPFSEAGSSAEQIAKYLFARLRTALGSDTRRVTQVTVWEDDDHAASYRA